MPGSTAGICPKPTLGSSCMADRALPSVIKCEKALVSDQRACSSRMYSSEGGSTKAESDLLYRKKELGTADGARRTFSCKRARPILIVAVIDPPSILPGGHWSQNQGPWSPSPEGSQRNRYQRLPLKRHRHRWPMLHRAQKGEPHCDHHQPDISLEEGLHWGKLVVRWSTLMDNFLKLVCLARFAVTEHAAPAGRFPHVVCSGGNWLCCAAPTQSRGY